MKAFAFRLEQALRWRETQVNLRKSVVAGAAGRLAEIVAIAESLKGELSSAAARIIDGPTGGSLESFAGFREKSLARIRDSEAQALIAQHTLTLEMNRLVEADRKLRLLENFKHAAHERWLGEFDRELAAFTDEAFLCRVHSKIQSKTGRMGA
jgi:hypothetical protein